MTCDECAASILVKGWTNVPGKGNLCNSCHTVWIDSQATPSLWAKIDPPPPPTCDLCDRIATWKHPAGGLRCRSCPRPDR